MKILIAYDLLYRDLPKDPKDQRVKKIGDIHIVNDIEVAKNLILKGDFNVLIAHRTILFRSLLKFIRNLLKEQKRLPKYLILTSIAHDFIDPKTFYPFMYFIYGDNLCNVFINIKSPLKIRRKLIKELRDNKIFIED